jgi:hypothetical protein
VFIYNLISDLICLFFIFRCVFVVVVVAVIVGAYLQIVLYMLYLLERAKVGISLALLNII